MNRKVFFLSDSTGLTAENLGKSLLVQFPSVNFETVTKPFISSPEKARKVVEEINQEIQISSERPIVIDTIVDEQISGIIKEANCFYIDIFSTFLAPLELEFGVQSAHAVGHPSILGSQDNKENKQYKQRMHAVHFALANDDGQKINRYDEADIILIGVSRVGKTPTSIYLGMQYGICAANYPLIPDDLEINRLPKVLEAHKRKLFGLTITARRLSEIRHERKPNSKYADLRVCMDEIRTAEGLYRQYQIPFIDTTQASVEEISARMLLEAGIERRAKSL